eukprot:COSAG05_NODE_437_length_9835_cov_3.761915_9_plen_48_part_00
MRACVSLSTNGAVDNMTPLQNCMVLGRNVTTVVCSLDMHIYGCYRIM